MRAWVCASRVAVALAALPVPACGEGGCGATPDAATETEAEAEAEPETETEVETEPQRGDPARGKQLVARFECNRCHEGTGVGAAPAGKRCVGCHRKVLGGDVEQVPPHELERWQGNLTSLNHAPSLAHVGTRLRRAWIAEYLQRPHDLRPGLPATMPRLDIGESQAWDIAAHLSPEPAPGPSASGEPDRARGRRLLQQKGCMTCHAFTGAKDALQAKPIPVPVEPAQMKRAQALAPDLRYTRDRFVRVRLAEWIRDPGAMAPDTSMPVIPMDEDEARAIARYILGASIAPESEVTPEPPERLPVLERAVSFDEVQDRVFRNVCWHCHSDPSFALGDGGPGNTGGFGFAPRRLDLASYPSILGGSVDDEGHRQSIFRETEDGTPVLVATLLARHKEVRGEPSPDIRGMPLGLPPLPPEDIQLVESWIAQGRPQ